MVLYRALRKLEIVSDYILIPKVLHEFKAHPHFGIDTAFPILFYSDVNAVRQHQWKQNGFPTRGISTTPYYERALFYAQTNKIIVEINVSILSKYSITTYNVNEILKDRPGDIAVPEDNEIILVYEKDGAFPKEIINRIIKI